MVFSLKQQKTCDKWIVGLKCRFDSKRDGLKLSCTLGKATKKEKKYAMKQCNERSYNKNFLKFFTH